MFSNVFCVEKEEGRNTVGVFMTLGGSELVDVLFLFVKGSVEKSALSHGTDTAYAVLCSQLYFYFFIVCRPKWKH